MKKFAFILSLVMVLSSSPNVLADPVQLLTNGGFETGGLTPWSAWAPAGELEPSNVWPSFLLQTGDAYSGDYAFQMSLPDSQRSSVHLRQSIAPFYTGDPLSVSFAIKALASHSAWGMITVDELGQNFMNQYHFSLASLPSDWTVITMGPSYGSPNWIRPVSVLTIGVDVFDTSGGPTVLLIDDISLTGIPQSVPDPSATLLLFGIGLMGLRAWRKRWQ